MTYSPYIIHSKTRTAIDTYLYHLKPATTETILFKPGQYVFLRNPQSSHPDEDHPFSIASSPLQTGSLEFCIKSLGDWTKELENMSLGSLLHLSEPHGSFTWDTSILHGVFLLGGIGISPIMSMLRFMGDMKLKPESLIMLYGNRTPSTAAYVQELKDLQHVLPTLKIVDIYSHLSDTDPWEGYRGFITRDILESEINLTLKPTFFYIGPPVFIEKMDSLLHELNVPEAQRRKEDFSAVITSGIL